MKLDRDIAERIRRDFATQADDARRLLEELAGGESITEPSRVVRCVLYLAHGKLDELRHYAGLAKEDTRDVIYWAEYDREDRQIRDFSRPFDS